MNITFDDIDLGHKANQSLAGHSFLEFKQFETLNTTAAAERGFIAPNDTNCASSKPNVIHSVSGSYPGPSIFKSNATALAAVNMTEYYDLISFVVKPLGPVSGDYVFVSVIAWEIDGKLPKDFHTVAVTWSSKSEYCVPVYVEPKLFLEGWGEKVNWVEMEAYDNNGEILDFCVDDVVVEFRGKAHEGDNEV